MAEAMVDEVTSPETGLVTRDQLKVEILESERRTPSHVDARFEQSEARLARFETNIVRQNWIAMMVLVVGLIATFC